MLFAKFYVILYIVDIYVLIFTTRFFVCTENILAARFSCNLIEKNLFSKYIVERSGFMSYKIKAPALRVGAVVVAALGFSVLSGGWACPLHAPNRGNSVEPAAEAPIAATRERGDGAASDAPVVALANGEPQVINSVLSPYGYPNITVVVGRPVKWIINAPPGSVNGCNYRFIIREYGIGYELRPGENVVEFTPNRVGKVPYSCWMGMIPGTITVVKG